MHLEMLAMRALLAPDKDCEAAKVLVHLRANFQDVQRRALTKPYISAHSGAVRAAKASDC